jgi:hypothetical protein
MEQAGIMGRKVTSRLPMTALKYDVPDGAVSGLVGRLIKKGVHAPVDRESGVARFQRKEILSVDQWRQLSIPIGRVIPLLTHPGTLCATFRIESSDCCRIAWSLAPTSATSKPWSAGIKD